MTKLSYRFSVLGGGSWATAIVKILCENLSHVCWYMRNKSAIEHIKKYHHNPSYLSSVEFRPSKITLTDDINKAVDCADYIVFAIPSAFLYDELEKLKVSLEGKVLFSAIKGIVPQTGMVVGDFLKSRYNIDSNNIGLFTGPCHAEEVALGRLSYLTVACFDPEKAQVMSQALSCSFIKTKISEDFVGLEYASMLKNIYAIAAGMAHSLGYGDNFQSVLMSNSIREMSRYIESVYSVKRDISESAYLGDLLVTGYSNFSRNRLLGSMIGKGYSLKNAFMEMTMVAEGYYAVKNAYAIVKDKNSYTYTPILDTVYRVLYEGENVSVAMKSLSEKLD